MPEQRAETDVKNAAPIPTGRRKDRRKTFNFCLKNGRALPLFEKGPGPKPFPGTEKRPSFPSTAPNGSQRHAKEPPPA